MSTQSEHTDLAISKEGVMALYGVVAILVIAQIFQFISNVSLAKALEKQD